MEMKFVLRKRGGWEIVFWHNNDITTAEHN